MTVELILYPQEHKSFDKLYPFQLFQLPAQSDISQSDIFVKVSANYARIINRNFSRGRIFDPTEQVILLLPELEDEEQ